MNANYLAQEHAANVHSQHGEDGVLRKILEVLPEHDRWCVEFGAWDGRHLSNTYRLIDEEGYRAVLIEGNRKRFQQLEELKEKHPAIIPVHCFVDTGANRLDAILQRTEIPRDFDVLSIDIDGNDYHIWESLQAYQPKVVCIEFNPSVPNHLPFVQENNPTINQGASLLSLFNLGRDKGYELVAVTQGNGIFVREQDFARFEITDNTVERMRPDPAQVTYLFHGYDGHVFLRGGRRLLWHNLELRERDVQLLPRWLQRHPGNMDRVQKTLFRLVRFLRRLRIL